MCNDGRELGPKGGTSTVKANISTGSPLTCIQLCTLQHTYPTFDLVYPVISKFGSTPRLLSSTRQVLLRNSLPIAELGQIK